MGVPLALAAGLSLFGQERHRLLFFLIMAGAGILAAMPHYLAMMATIDLGHMAGIQSETPELWPSLCKGGRILLSHMTQAHPLVVFLGLGGVCFLNIPGRWRFFVVMVLLLMIPAGWGEVWKPQYQLVRTGIPLMFLCILPTALWIDRLTSRPRSGQAATALIGAFLIAGTLSARSYYANQTPVHFSGMPDSVQAFTTFIAEQTQPEDRILFAGPMVHGVGGGHVAYLPVLTDREMLSCDYYAFSPKLVEYEYPPRAWRKRDGGVEAFLDLYNVSHVVTYHKRWITYFNERSDIYTREFTFGKREKSVYRVHRPSSLFLEGDGRIEAGVNQITVYPKKPGADLVIKYNWVDDLQIEPPAEMMPYPVDEELSFIRIAPNGLQKVQIFHKGVW